MKIDFDLKKENGKMPRFLQEAFEKGKRFSMISIFDKASFVERLWETLPPEKSVTVKFDEKKKDYPNILQDNPPRFIVQDDNKKILLQEHLEGFQKKGFDINLAFKEDEYFLTLKKSNNKKLDLGLKLDRDRTIDLVLLSDRSGKDKVFFGIKSFYYKKKDLKFL